MKRAQMLVPAVLTSLAATVAAGVGAPATSAAGSLVATVGPGATITVTRGGRRVSSLKAGRYTISVRDRSREHNFHLSGRGVNKSTSVEGKGTRTWTVTFKRGQRYTYVCDPHADTMFGSFRAT